MQTPQPSVVLVSDHASVTGGAEMVALTSAVGLVEAGLDVTFVAGSEPRDPRLAEHGFRKIEVLGATGFHQTDNKAAGLRNAIWNKGAAEMMERALAGLDPSRTVVHFHSYLSILSPSVMGAALDAGFPCVLTLHDYGIVCPTSGLYNHRKAKTCPLIPLSPTCILTQCSKRNYLSKLGLVWRSEVLKHRVRATQRLKHAICVSRRNGEIVRPFLPESLRIHHLRNPYQVPRSERVEAERNEALLFVGRLTSEKDPVRLAAAARRVGSSVVFVGTGPLEAEVKAANPDAVITGWLTQAEVAEWYTRGRANVMTSRWHEGSPLSLTDAAARGVPSVVPATMAGAENVLDGETGYLFPLEDDGMLDERLRQLQDDDAVRRLSARAYEDFWADPPTLAAHVEGLLRIYGEVLAGRHGATSPSTSSASA